MTCPECGRPGDPVSRRLYACLDVNCAIWLFNGTNSVRNPDAPRYN